MRQTLTGLQRVHPDGDRQHEAAVEPALGVAGHVDVVDVAPRTDPAPVVPDHLAVAQELEVVRDRQQVGEVADVGDEARPGAGTAR